MTNAYNRGPSIKYIHCHTFEIQIKFIKHIVINTYYDTECQLDMTLVMVQ